MNVRVTRRWFSKFSCVGILEAGGFKCFTLEPPVPIVPVGSYELILDPSPRFKRIMPEIKNVPGHQGVLIHWGNIPKDTIGCTLVGETYRPDIPDFIGNSRKAFATFFALLESEPGPHYISYVEERV